MVSSREKSNGYKEQNSDIGRSDSKVRKELITKGLIRLWK